MLSLQIYFNATLSNAPEIPIIILTKHSSISTHVCFITEAVEKAQVNMCLSLTH